MEPLAGQYAHGLIAGGDWVALNLAHDLEVIPDDGEPCEIPGSKPVAFLDGELYYVYQDQLWRLTLLAE